MEIEAIKMVVTLKCGGNIYPKGKVYSKSKGGIPADLLKEHSHKTGTVEVVVDNVTKATSTIPPGVRQSTVEKKDTTERPVEEKIEKEPEKEPEKELELEDKESSSRLKI